MKIKKIICFILVVCLLGGLLTINGGAFSWAKWLSGGYLVDAAKYNWSTIIDYLSGKIGSNSIDFDKSFKTLPTSPARVWTTVNCSFVTFEELVHLQATFTSIGVHSNLYYEYDKNDVGCFFLIITSVDDTDYSDIVGKAICIDGLFAAALNDNSTAIGGGMGGGGISGGGGGGRRGTGNVYFNDYDSDNNANNAYESIDGITDIPAIKNNTEEIHIYNDYTETIPDVGPIVDMTEGVIYDIGGTTSYNFDVLYYEGDTNSYHIEYTNSNNITEVVNLAYYIQYTVVNYVSLEETYVLYYELPDGRNSFDMTIDELSQYSGAFDVINYASSADNEDLLFLFPFNGNQENIAYNGTNFASDPLLSWTTGNSITYQETSGFGAALYLGNGNHTFNVTPGYITNYNYTKYVLSFRYYYSPRTNATAVYYPLTVTVGGLGFSYDGWNDKFWIGGAFNSTTGAHNNTYSDDFSVAMPVGQWCDITLQYSFNDGITKVYLFINGVVVGSYSVSSSYNSITPSFAVRNGDDGYSYIDELIGFKDIYFGSSVSQGFTPTLQPYDTNLILTLPSLQAVTVDSYVEDGKTYYYVYSPDQLWKPTIAVATDITVTQYYLGGVRPSLPKRGYVWVPINGGLIGTVQVYDGSGWLEVASRVWNGSRWVVSSNYNIFTNGTYTDLAVTVPPPVIADEQSFWAWCVESFDTLIATIKSVGGGGGAVADPDVIPEIIYPGIDSEGNTTEESTSIFDIVTDIVGGVVDIIGEVVGLGGNVGEFFGDFFDGVGDAFGVLNPNNQNGLFYVEVE